MSSFGGGFGGFGSNNNNNTSSNTGTGFGGFGANTGGTGFGSQQNTSTPFGGGNNTGTSMFGSGGTGFGSNTGGFGAAKPATGGFGSTGQSMFGSTPAANTTTNTGFGSGGGFGGGSAFGANANATGSSMFGSQNKPATAGFGTSTNSLFGGGNTGGTSGGFGGQNNTQSMFGGGNTDQCQGTTVPFSAFTEKEANSSVTNHFQSVSFMQPYQKFSFEELRIADYAAGRKYGNANGQAGAFGQPTFGAGQGTGTGFGANNTSTGFGAAATTSSTGFGNTTSTAFGGGFGNQQKPLFGQQTSAQQTGGLFQSSAPFGQTQQNNTGFGNNNNNTGTGLFGQQNQQKTTFGGFGGAANSSSSGTGLFGGAATAASGGGLFGQNQNQNQNQTQNQGTGLFGQNSQQPAAGGGLFTGQNQAAPTSFGAGFGNNANTNNQPKPGLFGNSQGNSAGGMFGQNQNQQQNQGGGLFGNTQNNANSGGLFAKPAATGTGLFGNNNANNNNAQGGGLFSGLGNNNQNQQNAGIGGFGNNQSQAKPNLFGGNNAGNAGSLFGNSQPNAGAGGNLFGGNNQNQNSILGNSTNSLFNNSQQNSLIQPSGLVASVNDSHPYGSQSLFSGLPPPPQENPGPIATPISAGQKQQKRTTLPQYRINPHMASKYNSPMATPNRGQSYGFSYSTYGTPSSVASTPGSMSNSFLGGSMSRSLGKSLSTSNLRRTLESDGTSVLSPGAFSASGHRYQSGSIKKLTIDRSLRTDLFASPSPAPALPSPERTDPPRSSNLKKKVSFDTTTAGGESNGEVNGDNSNYATPSAQESGWLRPNPASSTRRNGYRSSLGNDRPEMQQVTGKELAIVHEDGSPQDTRNEAAKKRPSGDLPAGAYWTDPPLSEIAKWTPAEKKKVHPFSIGRERVGRCVFDQPVDLSNIPFDRIYGGIAIFEVRRITIYPSNVEKPPMGRGLNVPSTITLEQSWPRYSDRRTNCYETSGPILEKHKQRLQRSAATAFVGYDVNLGEWTFTVPHFTTYGLDYEDGDSHDLSEGDLFQSSVLSEVPPTPTPKARTPRTKPSPLTERYNDQDTSMISEDPRHESSEPEDTFAFKTGRTFPGAFDDTPVFDDNQEMDEVQQNGMSFLGKRSVSPQSDNEDEPSEMEEVKSADQPSIHDEEMELVGSFPAPESVHAFPVSILKPDLGLTSKGTPAKPFGGLEHDWTEHLQRTVSPKKQDRQALRQSQAALFRDFDDAKSQGTPTTNKLDQDNGEIATSIDLMTSLFGKEQARKTNKGNKGTEKQGFKWPYAKAGNVNENEMSTKDRAFHNSFKPTWGPAGLLVYVADDLISTPNSLTAIADDSNNMSIDNRDLRISTFTTSADITEGNFQKQRDQAHVTSVDGVPFASTVPWTFETGTKYPSAIEVHEHESSIWELASILFDRHYDEVPADLPDNVKPLFQQRATKERLSSFWARLCREEATLAVAAAGNAEERAIAYLSMNKVAEACNALIEGKDFRLATLIAQIGGDRAMHNDIAEQIDQWRNLNVLSEMSDPIRALYELLAGNTCTAVGKKGPLEDRAKTFDISERFDMSWKRAFGLKLWYSTLTDEPLEVAVQDYLADLVDKDVKRPTPWFHAPDRSSSAWPDPCSEKREDVLWGILKLYADRSGKAGPLSAVVGPENTTKNPMSSRLSFELYNTLAPHFPQHIDTFGGDQLTLAFALELDAAGYWLWALHALLRLSDASARQLALQNLIAKRAGEINEYRVSMLEYLFDELLIPEQWVWEAKALFARTVTEDPVANVRYLLRAKNYDEAHSALCSVVAPQAIVERSYKTLQSLLDDFTHKPADWRSGGGVYSDYLRLVQNRVGSEEGAVLGRLVRELSDMKNLGFLQKVAVQDMSSVVGDKILAGAAGDAKEQAWVLQLPLTSETKRGRAAELSWGYYRKMMAMGG